MAGDSVGNAYLNVVPRVDGNAKSLGGSFGNDFSSGAKSAFSAGAVALGNILSNAITSVASAVGEQFSNAFWNYADYEQLVGGVDTLFKESSATVQENAKRAFETAGLSANEYMENVTSFSASLISSLGGDTEKAAEMADKAMVDMSDNANKMGTDMESITNAYQGFAKQNYTMLDNLKLGYGGTKEEMQRLLDDAGKIAGVEFNIDSYSDVIEAIHVMQESMGIAGTTMEEGSTTISGSINQLEGAWANFLTALGDGGKTMDMDQVTEDLVKSLKAVAKNVVPAVKQIGKSILSQMPELLGELFDGVREILVDCIRETFGDEAADSFDEAFGTFSEGVRTAFETVGRIIDNLRPVVEAVMSFVATVLSEVGSKAVEVAVNVVLPAVETLSAFVRDTVLPVFETIAGFVLEHLVPAFSELANFVMTTVVPDIMNLVSWVGEHLGPIFERLASILFEKVLPVIVDNVVPAIETMYNWFKENILPVIQAVAEFVTDTLVPAFMDICEWIGENVVPVLKDMWEWIDANVLPIFHDLWDFIDRNIVPVFETVAGVIGDVVDGIKDLIEWAGNAISDLQDFIGLCDDAAAANNEALQAQWDQGYYATGYATGGFTNGDGIYRAGERGRELVWPSYEPYISRYADAITASMGGGAGGGVDIHDCTFNVRSDSDIRRVAVELNTLINRQTAGAIA